MQQADIAICKAKRRGGSAHHFSGASIEVDVDRRADRDLAPRG